MGRLTLNVLLSFAQFEREVTAERAKARFSSLHPSPLAGRFNDETGDRLTPSHALRRCK